MDPVARRKAAERERACLTTFLRTHSWRIEDLASVLHETGLLSKLFGTREFTKLYMEKVNALMKQLEVEHFGEGLGMFLHFEMKLSPEKILQLSQAASKRYRVEVDRYVGKTLLHDRWCKTNVVYVPRIAPPISKLRGIIEKVNATLGVTAAENGRIAFRSFDVVIQELLARDPGRGCMPTLERIRAEQITIPIVISFDGTGFGSQSFNTIAVNNPYLAKSPENLHIFGLGNCKDDKGGTKRLLGPNRDIINAYLAASRRGECAPNGAGLRIKPYVVTDTAALRHTEHLAKSGWCGCSSDTALREVPEKPTTVEELTTTLSLCRSLTCEERFILSHSPLPGESGLPRPCTAKGCQFAHNPETAAAELAQLRATEKELAADASKKGKAAFSKWRMAHADNHLNVQPGEYGEPMLHHDMCDQLLDALHLAELNLPKIIFKYSLLQNASDDARATISDMLAGWKHPLDTRRKEDGRQRQQKWFTGAKFHSFCNGDGGSPGGPAALAELILIVADDLHLRGVDAGAQVAKDATESDGSGAASAASRGGRGGGRGRGRGGFMARMATSSAAARGADAATGAAAGLEHQPTALERAAGTEKLKVLRELWGSRAQTIINMILAWDGFFAWYYPFKQSVPLFCAMPLRQERALDNCRRAIDMQEIVERLSIRRHKSYLFHGAVFKVSCDILAVGDVTALDTSALELQNAETKRTATSSGCRRLATAGEGRMRQGVKGVHEGPARLVTTKGYGSSMSLSTLKNMLATHQLRRGEGVSFTPATRRKERVLTCGRTKAVRSGVKLEHLGSDYVPSEDTVLDAIMRLLARRAVDNGSGNE